MREQEQSAQLTKMRRIATGLLLLMTALFVVSRLLERDNAYLSFVAAFAEAAMVGALADWFAVTALFRSPLGLPIPHTAVIPKNKDRIGQSLADFLEHNFITEDIVGEELRATDFASAIAHWLARPENSGMVSRQLVGGVPSLLRTLDEDEDIARFLRDRLASALQTAKFAPFLAEVLGVLVANRHHQVLFDHFVGIAAEALEQNKIAIRQKVYETSPRWMPKAVDDRYFDGMLQGLQDLLYDLAQEGSEWRYRFQAALEELIDNLKNSPDYEARIAAIAADILQHPAFIDYMGSVWQDIKLRLLADAESADSLLALKLERTLQASSEALLQDDAVRTRLNRWLAAFATESIVARRKAIAELVSGVIRKWDADTLAHKLEFQVGKDLQYIRINGTLVGGLVGLVLHLVARAF